MEVLGIGPLELFFILIIALIFLGPRDMVKAGRTLGRYMRKIVTSPTWRMVQQTSRELRTLPNRMIREAGMEEDLKDLDQLGKEVGNQIGSLRKPFSAAAGEANKELQEALVPTASPAAPAAPVNPPVLDGLTAWTTPPSNTEPAIEAVEGADLDSAIEPEAKQEPTANELTSDATSSTNKNPKLDEP